MDLRQLAIQAAEQIQSHLSQDPHITLLYRQLVREGGAMQGTLEIMPHDQTQQNPTVRIGFPLLVLQDASIKEKNNGR